MRQCFLQCYKFNYLQLHMLQYTLVTRVIYTETLKTAISKLQKILEKFENINLERKDHGTTKSHFTPNIYIRSMN